jgi:sialic acid synthase SpsE
MLIVADIGSCHANKKEYLFEMIDRGSDIGIDVIKLQLFNDSYTKNGNIVFNREWWIEAYQRAKEKKISITASVFDKPAFDLIAGFSLPFIKFAYSQTDSELIEIALQMGHNVIASYDIMNIHKAIAGIRKLYVVTANGTPLYPVPFKVEFDGIFKPYGPFDGFSSHCLGIHQEINAIDAGANILEIHMTLGYPDIDCPDTRFSKKPKEIEKLVRMVKK